MKEHNKVHEIPSKDMVILTTFEDIVTISKRERGEDEWERITLTRNEAVKIAQQLFRDYVQYLIDERKQD